MATTDISTAVLFATLARGCSFSVDVLREPLHQRLRQLAHRLIGPQLCVAYAQRARCQRMGLFKPAQHTPTSFSKQLNVG
jgi:hypothetical protein